jgi:hypothetical protein
VNIELIDKLWSRTKQIDKCWLWQGGINSDKYGQIRVNDKMLSVHRLSVSIYLGIEYTGKWQANHTCENKRCWNPLHLYMGSKTENRNDGLTGSCNKGHLYSEHGRIHVDKHGQRRRVCTLCNKQASKRFREKEYL